VAYICAMLTPRWIGLTVLLLLGSQAQSASAQQITDSEQDSRVTSPSLRDHLSIAFGAHVAGASAYRSLIVPRATDYVLSFRGLLDPLGRYRADFGATLNPSQRISLTAFATASTLERNRFYGYGNASAAPQPAAFYRLDQMFFETGLSASMSLGASRNAISFGPFYRLLNTDRELPDGTEEDEEEEQSEAVDGGGVMKLLKPYGAGAFR